MQSFLIASGISVVLIVMCVMAMFEIMAHVWAVLPRLEGYLRLQILLTVLASFVGHTLTIWIFGLSYYGLEHYAGFGSLSGVGHKALLDYVYFSGVAYSSLGLGDLVPTGDMRLLIAVEVVLGLIFIGWTITFSYLVIEKYMTHKRERKNKR